MTATQQVPISQLPVASLALKQTDIIIVDVYQPDTSFLTSRMAASILFSTTANYAPVQRVANKTGLVTLDSADITDFAAGVVAAAPVQSVAGKTGTVTLGYADIPNFATGVALYAPGAQVQSVAGRTGAIVLTHSDITDFSNAVLSASPVLSVAGRGSNVTLESSDILDFSPAVHTIISQGLDVGFVTGANTPFLNLHSSGHAITYDAQISATGGSGTIGQGELFYKAKGGHVFDAQVTLPALYSNSTTSITCTYGFVTNVSVGLLYDLTAAQGTTVPEQSGAFRMTSSVGGAESYSSYKMALGAEMIANSGSSPAWAMTTVGTYNNGYSSAQHAVVHEFDQNYKSGTDATEYDVGLGGPIIGTVYVTGENTNTINFAIGISGLNKTLTGISIFSGSVIGSSFRDYSGSQISYNDTGATHLVGIALRGGYADYAIQVAPGSGANTFTVDENGNTLGASFVADGQGIPAFAFKDETDAQISYDDVGPHTIGLALRGSYSSYAFQLQPGGGTNPNTLTIDTSGNLVGNTIKVTGQSTAYAFQDDTDAQISYDDIGPHTIGLALRGTYSTYAIQLSASGGVANAFTVTAAGDVFGSSFKAGGETAEGFAFQDNSNATVSYDDEGAHTLGIRLRGGYTAYALQICNAATTTNYFTVDGSGNATLSGLFFESLPGNYANDTAAAAGGVAVKQVYRNGSVLMVRAS